MKGDGAPSLVTYHSLFYASENQHYPNVVSVANAEANVTHEQQLIEYNNCIKALFNNLLSMN